MHITCMPMRVLLGTSILRSSGGNLHHMPVGCRKSFPWKSVEGKTTSFVSSFTSSIFSLRQSTSFPVLPSMKSGRLNADGVENEGYLTLCGKVQSEVEIKRSKFVAVAGPVQDERAALDFISQVSDSKATHNCWAYKIGDRYRFNDDGEPGGTAGRPIYAAVEASGFDHVAVVVIRYFGGIKLGTGGLVRAYGKATSDCLSGATTFLVKPKTTVTLSLPYDLLGAVYPLLQGYGVEKIDEHYDADGTVVMQLLVEAKRAIPFQETVNNACKGHAHFKFFTSS